MLQNYKREEICFFLARLKRLRRCKHTNDINIKICNFFNEKDEIKKKEGKL